MSFTVNGSPTLTQQNLLNQPETKPSWTSRRHIVQLSLLWSATLLTLITGVMCYIAINDITISKTIAITLEYIFFALGFIFCSIVGSYVFGATWDINSFRNFVVAAASVAGKVQDDPNQNTNQERVAKVTKNGLADL